MIESRHKPVFRRRYGTLEVAVFEWPSEDGRISHTARLTYSFRRKENDEWESSDYLPTSELLAASKLFMDAHSAIHDRLQLKREATVS